MTVALVGPATDDQVEAVANRLRERGVDTRVWDVTAWPGETPLSVGVDAGLETDAGDPVTESGADPGTLAAAVDGAGARPGDVDAVWLRQLGFDPRDDRFAEPLAERAYSLVNQLREYRGVLLSLLRSLEDAGVPVVNPRAARGLHAVKPWQLRRLADAGVPVPATLFTNDPAEARAFVERRGAAVYKPVAGGGQARLIDADDLTDDRLARLANAPVQFQSVADGVDVRAFVVDGEVVAAGRLVTDGDPLDYRSAEHDVEPLSLPPAVADHVRRAADALGLLFTGVDVVVPASMLEGVDDTGAGTSAADGAARRSRDAGRGIDDDRGPVVLEANPSPMFVRFDELAGTDVAGSLADLLVEVTDA